MYLRTVCLKINLRLNNIFCYCLNIAFLSLLIIESSTHKSVSSHLWYHPNNFLTINLSSNSPLLNVPSSCSCLQTSSMSHQYSFSNSSTTSFAFSKLSISSQVLDSAMNPFHYTKYLSFPLTCCLFKILPTFHFFSPSIMTRAGCSFLCPSTCPTYLHILLILTTECIFTVLGSSNSTVFGNTIFFIL